MAAIRIPHGAYHLFIYKIQSHFAFAHTKEEADVFEDVVARYWRVDTTEFASKNAVTGATISVSYDLSRGHQRALW